LVGRWCPGRGAYLPDLAFLRLFSHRWKSILSRTLRWWILKRFQRFFVCWLRIHKIQLLSLLCFTSPYPIKFFWIIHKIIRFVGEVAVHLLLGLAINKIYKNDK
jgi:hypothetical protein